MFIGHFGVGFGAKRMAPRTSLGTLFLAAQFIDLLWPSLLLVGLERVRIAPGITRVTPLDFVFYPISHSLTLVVAWALLFGAAYWTIRRYRAGAIATAAAVVSHWVLDLVVHRPDLPLSPGTDLKVGFNLWSSLPATLSAEFGLFALGVALYARSTSAKDCIGSLGLWSLVLFLALIYGANIFGPPPSSAEAIAWVGQAQWLLVLLGFWIDRHRAAQDETGSRVPIR